MTAQQVVAVRANTDLAKIVGECGLESESQQAMVVAYGPHFEGLIGMIGDCEACVVTDATQVTEIKKSRDLRLGLRKIRVEAEHTRKALKEDALRKGQAIDKINKALLSVLEPLEQRMLDQETFAERAEAARIEALRTQREAVLRGLGVDTSAYKLGEMTQQAYDNLVDATKLSIKQREEAAAKAEAERKAKEKADAEERERMRAENERLRKEAEEREKAARAEREAAEAERRKVEEAARKERAEADAKLAEERRAREAAEAKAREAEAAAKKKAEAQERAAKAAARAPDKTKLLAVVAAIRAIEIPVCKAAEAQQVAGVIRSTLGAAADKVQQLIESDLS